MGAPVASCHSFATTFTKLVFLLKVQLRQTLPLDNWLKSDKLKNNFGKWTSIYLYLSEIHVRPVHAMPLGKHCTSLQPEHQSMSLACGTHVKVPLNKANVKALKNLCLSTWRIFW